MNKNKKLLVFVLITLVLIFCSCGNETTKPNVTDNTEKTDTATSDSTENTQETENSEDIVKEFFDTFSKKYPGYRIIDYAENTDESSYLLLAAVAQDTRDGNSSTIFTLSKYGNGKATLAAGLKAIYRHEDGISVDGDVIKFSLDVYLTDGTDDEQISAPEIHDYELTVTHDLTAGVPNINYKNKETVRES